MKLKTCFKVFLCAFIAGSIKAQSYNTSLIPDTLTKNANAVKREEELKIIIKDIDKAIIQHKYALTVLNENGSRYAVYANTYDKLRSLSDIDGNLYDASGKHLKNVKKKDIADYYDDDQMSLATDNRFKVHRFYYSDYPYTVQYEDEENLDGIFFLDSWVPQRSNTVAVQQSRLIIETPVNYQLRYKQFNYKGNPVIVNDGKKITYTWEVKNLKAFKDENFSPRWEELTTAVYLAPVEFKIEGYEGKMDTWKDLGKFYAALNNGRDALPDNVKKAVHDLTDGLKTTKDKAFALYDYLQKNTRYISVQLGVGSWQPFDANYVATKKYGDCKALSNYMVSLLKEAGVKAYYVLVNADDEDLHGLWEDFPSPYFNHAVSCVPDGKDTLWFECTNQTVAPGYMGAEVGNRKALMIADDGGYIVNTPVYSPEDNLQIRTVSATIDSDGNLTADLITNYTGIQQDIPHALIHEVNKDIRDKYLNDELGLPTYQVDKTSYSEKKQLIPEVKEELQIKAQSYATFSGKRLFIKPNLFNRLGNKYDETETRLFDIDYPYSFHDIDSIEITIPKGYSPESLPKDLTLTSKFGSYKISYTANGDKLKVERDYIRFAGRFPVSDFSDFAKFYNDIYKADRSQVVLVKEDIN
jgi:transglutaminase-like putative cysteine protease